MKKKLRLISAKDGRIAMSFDGFAGNECFIEADKIKSVLKRLGVNLEIGIIEPKESSERNQVEGAKNEQKY